MSVGDAISNSKVLDAAVSELQSISGQKAVVTKAKKSIAAFKLREGMNIGAKVTLRGDRMYVFLDKLFNIVLPRIRDFRGLPRKSFDGRGNYNLGLREQIVFPEINFDKVDKMRGMDIVIVTSAKNDEEATEFLTAMGLPLQKTGHVNGEDGTDRKIETQAEVQGARAQPVPALRTAARRVPQVRAVPHLLPRERA